MRLATVVLAIGLGLAAAPIQAQDRDFGFDDVLTGLGRALSPE